MTKSSEKTALITGSTDGVGRVVAKRLADEGWRALVHGRDRGRGEALVADIKAAGGTAEFCRLTSPPPPRCAASPTLSGKPPGVWIS